MCCYQGAKSVEHGEIGIVSRDFNTIHLLILSCLDFPCLLMRFCLRLSALLPANYALRYVRTSFVSKYAFPGNGVAFGVST